MTRCKICNSYAINHHAHGRDGSDGDLCDVCYWRKRAEQARKALTDDQWQDIADLTGSILTRHTKDRIEMVLGITEVATPCKP